MLVVNIKLIFIAYEISVLLEFVLPCKTGILSRCHSYNSEYITVNISISLKSQSVISNIKCII